MAWFVLTWRWLVLCIWFNFRCFIFRSLFGRFCCVYFVCVPVSLSLSLWLSWMVHAMSCILKFLDEAVLKNWLIWTLFDCVLIFIYWLLFIGQQNSLTFCAGFDSNAKQIIDKQHPLYLLYRQTYILIHTEQRTNSSNFQSMFCQ